MNIKVIGILIVLSLIWLAYYEILKTVPKPTVKQPNRLRRRLSRMLSVKTPVYCGKHLTGRRSNGKMVVVDANNCITCKRSKKNG